MMDIKTILGIIASLMTIAAHIPYLVQTVKGTNKPHIFTWIIWTLLTFIAFAAQVVGNAGPGAWVTGFTGVMCVFILIAAFRIGEKDITRSDWVMFIAGLMTIPVWILTDDPLWAICIVMAIDAAAFYPTFRKAWNKPFEEDTFMYGFNMPRHMVALSAISTYSIVTTLYPAGLLLMNLIMYVMLKLRRAKLA